MVEERMMMLRINLWVCWVFIFVIIWVWVVCVDLIEFVSIMDMVVDGDFVELDSMDDIMLIDILDGYNEDEGFLLFDVFFFIGFCVEVECFEGVFCLVVDNDIVGCFVEV